MCFANVKRMKSELEDEMEELRRFVAAGGDLMTEEEDDEVNQNLTRVRGGIGLEVERPREKNGRWVGWRLGPSCRSSPLASNILTGFSDQTPGDAYVVGVEAGAAADGFWA